MWQLWTVLLAKGLSKEQFEPQLCQNYRLWDLTLKPSAKALVSWTCSSHYHVFAFIFLVPARIADARPKKKAAIYMKYPATLAHTCSWANNPNNPKQVPLVYKEFGIHLPSSSFCLGGTRYAQIWCRNFSCESNMSVSCAKWENFAIKAKHWSTDAIASFWWNHMALRLMPSVCQTPGRVDYLDYSTVHFLHRFSPCFSASLSEMNEAKKWRL